MSYNRIGRGRKEISLFYFENNIASPLNKSDSQTQCFMNSAFYSFSTTVPDYQLVVQLRKQAGRKAKSSIDQTDTQDHDQENPFVNQIGKGNFLHILKPLMPLQLDIKMESVIRNLHFEAPRNFPHVPLKTQTA